MNVTLPPQLQEFVTEQVQSGRFSSESEVVTAALEAMQRDPFQGAPVYPPGSLAHVYSAEANVEEAKTIRGNSLRVEEW